MKTQHIAEAETGPQWQKDETLAVIASFPGQNTVVKGKDIRFADHVDIEKMPRGKVLSSEEYYFVVVPTSTWNSICETLGQAVEKAADFRKFTPGRAYQISNTNIIWKDLPNGDIRVMLKMSMKMDADNKDFADTVRWTQSRPEDGGIYASQGKPVNGETHPFVIITLGAWNNFQFLIDEYNIREQFRKHRPLATAIKSNSVIRITQTAFDNLRNKE